MTYTNFSMSIGILLGLLVLLASYSDAAKTKKKKDHDKRQIFSPLLYRPPQSRFRNGRHLTRPYFPATRYQYNSAFKKVAPVRPNMNLQSAYTGSRRYYPDTFNTLAQRRYTSYYFPHETHYRDWSQKLVEASAYARKLQEVIKQERLQKLKSDPSHTGVKLFVAGVNRNGKAIGQWIDHGKVQKPIGPQPNQAFLNNKLPQQNVAAKISNAQSLGSTRLLQQSAAPVTGATTNNGPPSGAPVVSKPNPQIQTSQPIVQNPGAPAKANAVSSILKTGGAVVGDINTLLSPAQANAFLSKGSTAKSNVNEAILSDNLGGATLGPNAHSLLQPTKAQQPESKNGALGNVQGRQNEPKQSSASPSPKANSVQDFAPLLAGANLNKGLPNNDANPSQGKPKNVPSSKDPPISTSTNTLQANTAQKNTSPPSPNASLTLVPGPAAQTKGADNPENGNAIKQSNTVTGGSQAASTTPTVKSVQAPNALADSTNIDKSTAKQLTAGIASTAAARPPSQPDVKQPSTPKAGSRNNVPGNKNRVQTQIDKELALKNLLFPPPPAASRNQVHGTVVNAFQKPQPQQISQGQFNNMIPTFPAFRYDPNLPANGQTAFNSYRRNGIPRVSSAARNKKFMVPQHNPVPYKGSFPLMLHKISPYFKMKRNLKQLSSEQAKARRRFLELQPIK